MYIRKYKYRHAARCRKGGKAWESCQVGEDDDGEGGTVIQCAFQVSHHIAMRPSFAEHYLGACVGDLWASSVQPK